MIWLYDYIGVGLTKPFFGNDFAAHEFYTSQIIQYNLIYYYFSLVMTNYIFIFIMKIFLIEVEKTIGSKLTVWLNDHCILFDAIEENINL